MKKNNIILIHIIFFINFCFASGIKEEKIISGNYILVGDYVVAKNGKPTLVLLHGLASVRGEWGALTKILEKDGFGYFSFDLRGHGQSNRTVSGKQVTFNDFKKFGPGSEWEKMISDLDTVIKFLVKEKNVKEENIILCGASLGANICLIYASKNLRIKKLILLSPGWEYAGLKTENSAKTVASNNVRMLFSASPRDVYAYSSTRQLMKIIKSSGSEVIFLEGKDAQHGVQMFEKEYLKNLVDWLNNN
ncbi:MAG: alpha/beta fold hydrolase [Endomicrobiia bacterium]